MRRKGATRPYTNGREGAIFEAVQGARNPRPRTVTTSCGSATSASDFSVAVTATFRLVYVFLVLEVAQSVGQRSVLPCTSILRNA